MKPKEIAMNRTNKGTNRNAIFLNFGMKGWVVGLGGTCCWFDSEEFMMWV